MTLEIVAALRRGSGDLFSDVDDGELEQFVAASRVVRIKKDQYVFYTGGDCNAFLILVEGCIRVQVTSSSGRQVTLYRIEPGASCTLTTSCLLSHEHYPAEALAETDITAIALPIVQFEAHLDRHPWFRRLVFGGFAGRLTQVIRRIEEIAFTSIDARLATVLHGLAEQQKKNVTHQQLAAELGTAREVVSRHLKRFEDLGLVRLGRGEIVVPDSSGVRELANRALGD